MKTIEDILASSGAGAYGEDSDREGFRGAPGCRILQRLAFQNAHHLSRRPFVVAARRWNLPRIQSICQWPVAT